MINDTLLLESLHNYYSNPYNRDKLIGVLKDANISLRSIDWFITNYSKKNNSYYIIYQDVNGNPSVNKNNLTKSDLTVIWLSILRTMQLNFEISSWKADSKLWSTVNHTLNLAGFDPTKHINVAHSNFNLFR